MRVNNIIGGASVNLSGKYFKVRSQFYKDFEIEVPDAEYIDISIAISKVKQSWDISQALSFKERVNIVNKASKNLKFSKSEIESVVKLIGMPVKYVEEQIYQIPKIMANSWKLISSRYGFKYEKIGLDFIENDIFHKIEFRIAKKGFIYAITPGNDPRITGLITTIMVLLGIPGIIKPSKTDNIIPQKVVNAFIDAGYPKNSLAVIFFNSEKENAKELNFKICDDADIIWPFGDDDTINNLIRLEKKEMLDIDRFTKDKNVNPKTEFPKFLNELQKMKNLDGYLVDQMIDHFSSKTILSHRSGKCTCILDKNFDLDKAVSIILDSAFRYPIGCNAMKSVFIVNSVFDEFVSLLLKKLNEIERSIGDPLKSTTKIGYIDNKTLTYLKNRLNELKRLQLITLIHGGKFISETQATPILVSTNDINSELLINEIPAYILCLTKIDSFAEGVEKINNIAKNNPKLAVSYLTTNTDHMKMYVNAHHLKINYLTTDIDGIIHEGNDYIMQLTRPYVVHIHKDQLKTHPYRPSE